MRLFSSLLAGTFLGATALAGCGNWSTDELARLLRRGGEQVPAPGGGGDAGSMTGSGGAGSASGGDGMAGEGGDNSDIVACGALVLSSSLQLAPAAPGQRYVRCDTLGPEASWQVILSADGRRLAARTAAGTLRLLAADTWREVAQLASPLGRIDAAAFSPDGHSLAVLSAEMGQVAIWNADDGTLVRTFAGPPASTIDGSASDGSASALAFSSDGARLATSLGTLIDLKAGVVTDWKTGMPVDSVLAVNPENLGTGDAIPMLAFSAGDGRLFVHTAYQIGNSPTSTRLSLRRPGSGQEIVLFDFYSRGLTGFALSPDGRFVALAKTEEAQVAGFQSGLAIYRADTGAPVAVAPGFVGAVVGFSHDGQRLFTLSGSTIGVLASDDLHSIWQFSWPAGTSFLGVSPADELVGSGGGSTSWWDSATGSVVRTVSHALNQIGWSRDGLFAAATGDPAALFYLLRVYDGIELCAPPPRGAPAPALASLGTTLDANGMATSADGSITATDDVVLHTHASNYTALHIRAAGDGTLLRLLGATPARRPLAISAPTGARLFTAEGFDVAVWCH